MMTCLENWWKSTYIQPVIQDLQWKTHVLVYILYIASCWLFEAYIYYSKIMITLTQEGLVSKILLVSVWSAQQMMINSLIISAPVNDDNRCDHRCPFYDACCWYCKAFHFNSDFGVTAQSKESGAWFMVKQKDSLILLYKIWLLGETDLVVMHSLCSPHIH